MPHPHGIAVRTGGTADGTLLSSVKGGEVALQAAQYEAQRPRVHHADRFEGVENTTVSNGRARCWRALDHRCRVLPSPRERVSVSSTASRPSTVSARPEETSHLANPDLNLSFTKGIFMGE